MNRPKGFLFALLIIIITSFVVIGFSQENKKESTPQEKTVTEQQEPGEKDLKPQEKKKPEEKKSTPSEEAQEKYDEAELLRESQRNLDRSLSTLNTVATLIAVLIALIALFFSVAGITGFFQIRKWAAIRKDMEEDAKYIKELRSKAESEYNEIKKDRAKLRIIPLREKPTKEEKDRLEDISRRLESIEWLGMPLTAEDYFTRGIDLYYKNNFEFSLKAFDKATELEPGYIDAWINKGISLMSLERFEEALKASNKAIELKPNDPKAWVNKGLSLIRLERFEEALEASKTEKRKIFIDVYTDWCGWCKVMDKNTFNQE